MAIFAAAPFQNDLSMGGPLRFSLAEIHLLLTLPVFIAHRRTFKLGPIALPVAAYLGICIVSSSLNWRPSTPVALAQMIVYLVMAVAVFRSLPRHSGQYHPALIGLVAVCCVLASFALARHSGYVLGLHKNGTGGSLACGLIVCTELWFAERDHVRKQWLLGALILIASGLFFTLSRGAWMTAVTGVGVILALRRQFRIMLRAGLVFVTLATICWKYLPADSREYATAFERKNFNIQARYDSLDYAMELFRENPITGVGVGLRKEFDATNVIMLTLAETGIPGLFALLSIHLAFLRMIWKSRSHIRRSCPEYSLIAIAAALVIGKMMHGAVDHYWGRGDTMIVWASAGMAIRVCNARKRIARHPRNSGRKQSWPAPQLRAAHPLSNA